jgi:hypothetical protein
VGRIRGEDIPTKSVHCKAVYVVGCEKAKEKRQDERGKADATAELKDAGTSVTRMEDLVNGCEVG